MSCEVFNESDFGMIEGSTQTINLNIYNMIGEEYKNILIIKVEWRMSKYGETECLISKNSDDNPSEVIFDKNNVEITLLANDTLGLYGKYTHQAIITDYHSNIFIIDLGKISIKPQIK